MNKVVCNNQGQGVTHSRSCTAVREFKVAGNEFLAADNTYHLYDVFDYYLQLNIGTDKPCMFPCHIIFKNTISIKYIT
jgi:hypothetical protein